MFMVVRAAARRGAGAPPCEASLSAVAPGAVGSLPDDLALHRAQQTEQLARLPRADTVLVERFGQILDGRVPLTSLTFMPWCVVFMSRPRYEHGPPAASQI